MNVVISYWDSLYGEHVDDVRIVSIMAGKVRLYCADGRKLCYQMHELRHVGCGRRASDERRGITFCTTFRNGRHRLDRDAKYYAFNPFYGCGNEDKAWRSRNVKEVVISDDYL